MLTPSARIQEELVVDIYRRLEIATVRERILVVSPVYVLRGQVDGLVHASRLEASSPRNSLRAFHGLLHQHLHGAILC